MNKKRFFLSSLLSLAACSTLAFSAGYDAYPVEYSEIVQNILLTQPDNGSSPQDYLSNYLSENFEHFSDSERENIFQTIFQLNQKPFMPAQNTHDDFLFAQQLEAMDLNPPRYRDPYPQHKENPALKEKFKEIHTYLTQIAQHSDVHVLDNYVFGSQKTITPLLEIGRFYELGDDGSLNLSQVGAAMKEFVESHADFFTDYTYEDQSISKDSVLGIIHAHFSNMDAEILPVCTEAREIWSRTWTLSQVLYNRYNDLSIMKNLFDEVIEGHLTKGGCIQGRINRGFVGYVSLLGKAGVGSFL